MNYKLPIFDVKNLCFRASSQDILTNISFKIYDAQYIAIIGPNGGGKTTLIRILLGLQKQTSGDVKIFGKDVKEFKEWQRIGFVPQRASLVDTSFPATVEDVVKMGITAKKKLFSKDSLDDLKNVEDAMKKMAVYDLKDRMVGTLSGGQRQRVMIARALSSNPDILILDEPNTGVDMVSQKRFYALLKELNIKQKITIVFITHDIGVIADDIARLFTINQKAIICDDPKKMMSCEDVSELYGIDAHFIHNHKHEH